MVERITTIVIEARSLLREALVSLMAGHDYQIVGDVASAADIPRSLHAAEAAPCLAILGPNAAPHAATTAGHLRRLWPAAKIILLFDSASPADFQSFLASEMDACIPLRASPAVLIETIERVTAANLRMLLVQSETSAATACSKAVKMGAAPSQRANSPARKEPAECAPAPLAYSFPVAGGLSEREQEVLKGLVRGHPNRKIADTCGITEAGIKILMKSILRKIRVTNRTQAAIWGLGRGYGADGQYCAATL